MQKQIAQNKGKGRTDEKQEVVVENKSGSNPVKGLQSHIKSIEQPPKNLKSNDLADQYWFITVEGKVIVEPPVGYLSGKFKAFVWLIEENFWKKNLRNREFIVSKDFNLDPDLYKVWPNYKFWTEHAGIGEAINQAKSIDAIKSKFQAITLR